MPVLRLVQAAHANIAHCVMNKGYKIRNGGLGKVMPIHTAHVILMNQAEISKTNLNGQSWKSRLAQLYVFFTNSIIQADAWSRLKSFRHHSILARDLSSYPCVQF